MAEVVFETGTKLSYFPATPNHVFWDVTTCSLVKVYQRLGVSELE